MKTTAFKNSVFMNFSKKIAFTSAQKDLFVEF